MRGPTNSSSVEYMFRVGGSFDPDTVPNASTLYEENSKAIATMQSSWGPSYEYSGEIVATNWPAGATVVLNCDPKTGEGGIVIFGDK